MTDQAKAMTAGEKVAKIEQTVGKNNVRNSVARQTEEYLYYMQEQSKCPSVMRVASLAAENWYSEYLLKNYLEHSWLLTNPPELHFISAERSKSVANRSYVNMPDNATVLKGNFSDIFNKPFKTARAGYSYLTSNESTTMMRKYGLVWADYCCYTSVELLNDLVHVIKHNIDKGLIYVTFCISATRGNDIQTIKKLRKYSSSSDIYQATISSLNHFLRKIKNKKVRKVFEVVYGGGGRQSTTMITIGYSVNLPTTAVTPISFDDSEWKSKDRIKRQCVVSNRLSKLRGWQEKKRRKKVQRAKLLSSKEQARLEKAVIQWEGKWKDLSKARKVMIAEKYGVTLRQFGSKVACRHGKHAKNRGIK